MCHRFGNVLMRYLKLAQIITIMIIMLQTIIYRINKQQILLYSTRSYIQYPVINHNGKEYEKEYMCVCVCVHIKLNHFAGHQKLTQHCKSTIPQLKIK